MSIGEFDLIAKYFNRPARRAALGVGDDCALLTVAPGQQLAVSCDTLIEGRHFLSTIDPFRLGHKALAVNLSDLAASGATPLAFTLALAMPRVDERFLAGFSAGLYALAEQHDIDLVGGDTTAGPLAITINVFGEVPVGQALLRGGARVGDDIWVSHAAEGGLGDARLALEAFRGTVSLEARDFDRVRRAMESPTPRVALGLALRAVAHSAIDISDGLLGDLAHVLHRSAHLGQALGARLDTHRLPMSPILAAQPLSQQLECTLAGGDDYELCFTAPADRRAAVLQAARKGGVSVTCIGVVEGQPGLRLVDAQGRLLPNEFDTFDHFRQ